MSGILTKAQFEASLRVLRTLKTPQSATVILTWDDDMQRAYPGLARMGYVTTREQGGSGRGSFRWDKVETTPLGRVYLSQIEETIKKDAAEKSRR